MHGQGEAYLPVNACPSILAFQGTISKMIAEGLAGGISSVATECGHYKVWSAWGSPADFLFPKENRFKENKCVKRDKNWKG